MADSNITKRALAAALQELMKELPFEKISVSNICEKCGMNRKSFYYHFRDKYDLVNWIFDTEMIALMKGLTDHRWGFFESVCNYFFDNREFYRKAMQIKGQNSFSEHFWEFLQPIISNRIEEIIGKGKVPQLCVDFLTDGLVSSIERWLLEQNCMPAEEFVSILKTMIYSIASDVCRNIEQENKE